MGAASDSGVVGGLASWVASLPWPVLVLVVLPALWVAVSGAGLYLLAKLPAPVPFRWEVRLFLLMGMPADQYLAFVIKNGVDPVFWHRALYGAYISLMNAFFWIPMEEAEYPPERIEQVPIKHPPVFIVGHYRSGTSLLHELLVAGDPEHLVAPTAFQCYTPRIFLGREEYMAKRFAATKMERPMDSMKVGLTSPFEDEFAIANLSGLSPYMGAIFPRQYHHYERYLSLKDCSPEEVAAWKRTITFFFKKVLYRQQDKRLILKSPSHTARVGILRELFPGAKFIHISRNPYEIYQSTHKLHEKLLIQWCLQRPPYEDKTWVKGNIISHFRRMYDAYFQDVKKLRPDELMDIRYADLIASPTKTVEAIYRKFGLPGFDRMRPNLEQYERDQKTFAVNKHSTLSAAEKAVVQQVWADYFDYYKYEK